MTKIVDRRNEAFGGNNTRPLSVIADIVRHCDGVNGGTIEGHERYWHETLGWVSAGGYHEWIDRDGTVYINYGPHVITNGVGGRNTPLINICLAGIDSFTAAQEKAYMERVIHHMKQQTIAVSRNRGHNEYPGVAKICPGINMNTVRNAIAKKTPVGATAQVSAGGRGSFASNHPNWWDQKGDHIAEIQTMLNEAGFSVGDVDGHFGQKTLEGVRSFQSKYNISSPQGNFFGAPGNQTVSKLKKVTKSQTRSQGYLEHGDDGKAVENMQNQLMLLGYKLPQFGADGHFGDESEKALRAFQKDAGITVDGLFGKSSMTYLEEALAEKDSKKKEKEVTTVKPSKKDEKEAPEPKDEEKFRLMTGTFPDAEALDKGIKRLEAEVGWILYERADDTGFNPSYRIYTGFFTGQNVAEKHAERIREMTNWTVYVIPA